MGIFYDMTNVVNRAPEPITVRFDGQDMTLTPGENRIPTMAVQYGKNQNPIMGSQDPLNPHISGASYLLGIVGIDDCTPLTEEEWAAHLGRPCRLDEQAIFEERYGQDPKARMVVHGTKRSKSSARSRSDAGGGPGGVSSFEKDA